MEEERNELPAPPESRFKGKDFRYKFIKYATLTVLFLAVFFGLGFFGLEATSSSEFCASCHEMKPEVYTWQASTHSEVDCTNCHTDPVFKTLAKDKVEELVDQIKKQSAGTSAAPIRMPGEIPDSVCESCHNVFTREVTPSGDLIIPHDKHKTEGVECIQCHSGVAHGKVADRKMTYKTDLDKWDSKVGKAAMADLKFSRPDMDTCMECHRARKATLECTACHTTGMVPKSHKKPDFKLVTHGKQAKTDLNDCNECHKGMSKVEIDGYEEASTLDKILNSDKSKVAKKSHYQYAKDNTFCRDCHSKRPPSHTNYWMKEHGGPATEDREGCIACHNYQPISDSPIQIVSCASCHPSSHSKHSGWERRHPVQLAPNQKLVKSCYQCHNESKCGSCHTDTITQKNKKNTKNEENNDNSENNGE